MHNAFLLFLILCTVSLSQEISKLHSFAPPFNNYAWSGNRRITGWTCGDNASIKEFFIRLTPDRQSKSGYCWSDTPLNSNKWVTTFKFRISGQGEYLFGDGMTFFFTNQKSHESGELHGSSDEFVGFAVNLATYKNQNYVAFHRDIGLYVGNSTKEHAYHPESYHPGCFSSYRYYEKRQDFTADKFASVRVAYDAEAETIRVTVDAQGSGFFQSCVSEKVQLPAEWWKTATVGVSASTGQVADNHDLISVETWLGVAEVPEQPEQQLTAREEEERLAALLAAERVEAGKLDPSEKALFAIVSELATQQEREVAKLKRELEHSLAAIDDSINTMIRKLQKRGDVSEVKIEALEEDLKRSVTSSVSGQIANRLTALEKMLDSSMKREVKKSKGTWVVPFVLLVVVLVAVFFFIYKEYRHIEKTHML
ncbi:hypothetical protein WA538_002511 [Blastocystis sp. DL]